MNKKLLPNLLLLILLPFAAFSQGTISGSLETNNNFYIRDSIRGAINTPQYDNLLSSTDAWLNLNYFNFDWNFNAGIRFDLYNNSILFDPLQPTNGIGIGRFYVSKEIQDLTITGGYFYDQFGSGITFRAYEERTLGIDNAVLGIHAKYQFSENWFVKAFTGRQKNIFSTFAPILKGANGEGFHAFSDDLSIAPGASIVNRTLDQASIDLLVSNISTYPVELRFVPKYNVFAYSFYNRLSYKDISWYIEYAGKTNEAILDNSGIFIDRPGSVIYSTLTYSRSFENGRGFGITGQVKRTEDYPLRIAPDQTLLRGQVNFLPPLARQNTYTLLARYNAATQFLGEKAYQIDLIATPIKNISISLNHSNVYDLSNNLLFREFYGDILYKRLTDWRFTAGVQVLDYNQVVYENKGDSVLSTITPFAEVVYKFSRRKSLRAEVQYQHNNEDFGSWVYGLLEYSIAPKWSFAVADMYNIAPKKTADALHYYTIFGSYTKNANRFALSYVKQVEGIVCTGGVCRYEPAFSGFKFTINSTF